ncbi:MAG: carboxymuconolactone decarboxylase family protein [Candidatus Krumholzibacteriota bacterium]|nr:carboxymuconolactone decarboxylase family protein [Candidatus Krumholzibacteriota bacterium]
MAKKWEKNFFEEREMQNELIFSNEHLGIKRFFALDDQAYHGGALDEQTKELMGLVASMVLRCDDCVSYHLKKVHEAGATKEQIYEAFNVALIVGGSIVIPHLRKAAEKLESL